MAHHDDSDQVFGVIAQFATSDELLHAAKVAHSEGYRAMDAYSPIPVHGVYEAMGYKRSWLAWMIAAGGTTGFLTGCILQYWVSAIAYPVIVGGRHFNSWPAFIPICFELTILFSALTAVFGMFALNGLPRPYHPIFNAENFELATMDRFFLCIESTDENFDENGVASFLRGLKPENVSTVNA